MKPQTFVYTYTTSIAASGTAAVTISKLPAGGRLVGVALAARATSNAEVPLRDVEVSIVADNVQWPGPVGGSVNASLISGTGAQASFQAELVELEVPANGTLTFNVTNLHTTTAITRVNFLLSIAQ